MRITKDFIEVTCQYDDTSFKELINIKYIISISPINNDEYGRKTIIIIPQPAHCYSYHYCLESYDEIKAMIADKLYE